MAAYFKKVSPRIPVALSSGAFVKFDPIDLNTGILKTEDPDIIAGLTALIGSGRGGVSSLTETEYEDLVKKKLAHENTSRRFSQINEVQTAGLVTIPAPLPAPQTPLLPTPSSPVNPVAINSGAKPLTEPPPIKLGKSK